MSTTRTAHAPAGGRRRDTTQQHRPRVLLHSTHIPAGAFAVIDPYSKKLLVPLESMLDTRAMHRAGVPSLCRVFLEGRCRQGANCLQAHADVAVVRALRDIALAEPSCCRAHGAYSDDGDLPRNVRIKVVCDSGAVVFVATLSHVVVTSGLRSMLAAQLAAHGATTDGAVEVSVPLSSLCRLHSCGAEGVSCCRFSDTCLFVHVCRELHHRSICAVRADSSCSPLPLSAPPSAAARLDVMGSERAVSCCLPHGSSSNGKNDNSISKDCSSSHVMCDVCGANVMFASTPPVVPQSFASPSLLSPAVTAVVRDTRAMSTLTSMATSVAAAAATATVGATTVTTATAMPSGCSAMMSMCNSADAVKSPHIQFDPFSLAVTAPVLPAQQTALFRGNSVLAKSLDSTRSGELVWRHNPYASPHGSSSLET